MSWLYAALGSWVLVGTLAAFRWLDWRGKTFYVSWLAPWTFASRAAGRILAVVAMLLAWPLVAYLRARGHRPLPSGVPRSFAAPAEDGALEPEHLSPLTRPLDPGRDYFPGPPAPGKPEGEP